MLIALVGINLIMYFLTLQGLLRKNNHNSPKSRRFFAIYSTILLLLITVDVSVNAVWGELMWIEGRNGPGGVPGFIATQTAAWYQTMGSAAVVIMIFMGDALLVGAYICPSFSTLIVQKALPPLCYIWIKMDRNSLPSSCIPRCTL
jgi:hypothetical protein